MDDDILKKIISDDNAPHIDENARKVALNLAMAEFKLAKSQKNQKTSQGYSIFTRLTGYIKTGRGKNKMEQKRKNKFIYGGMATAMAVVLVVGIGLPQLQDTVERNNIILLGEPSSASGAVITSGYEIAPSYSGAKEKPLISDPQQNMGQDQGGNIQAPFESQATYNEAVGTKQKNNKDKVTLDSVIAGSGAAGISSEDKKLQISEGINKGAIKADGQLSKSLNDAPTKSIGEFDKTRRLEEQESDLEIAKEHYAPASSPVVQQFNQAPQSKIERTRGPAKNHVFTGRTIAEPISPQIDIITPIYQNEGRDAFQDFKENAFKQVSLEPVSTFSSDVDTASYSFIRKQLNSGNLPHADAVRIEEMVNYFDYDYPVPKSSNEPFQPTITITDSPWAKGKKLLHIGIKGYEITGEKPRSNLVFLLDVSGSMSSIDKLPLVKNSMKMLLDNLGPDDTIAIAVYAGAAGTVLEPTKASERHKIMEALNRLSAGGSTAGAAGIDLAYKLAEQNFDKGAINRVIIATDGDFNVGITDRDELKSYVERKRESGVFLSVLGFGQGNYNDHLMQMLAQNGNGVAAYIDNLNEARKVLVEEATSTLFPIAKDVKFQIEFNPATVSEYRLIGYETRHLNREDFNNDKIDAGDMGAGHTVTAIYEFVPVGSNAVSIDPLRYGGEGKKSVMSDQIEGGVSDITPPPQGEYAFLKIRYKLPNESKSKLLDRAITNYDDFGYCHPLTKCKKRAVSADTNFATAVAAFGQILKGGQYTGGFSYDDVIAMAQNARGHDQFGYRAEFIQMVRLAKIHRR